MTEADNLQLSRLVAVVLALVYCCYLFFQLKTHAHAFTSEVGGGEWEGKGGLWVWLCVEGGVPGMRVYMVGFIWCIDVHSCDICICTLPQEEEEEPSLSKWGALLGLTACTLIVAVCSELLTGSLEAVANSTGLSADFLGLIVLPIAGNACEHLTAVYVAGQWGWWGCGGMVWCVHGVVHDSVCIHVFTISVCSNADIL